MSKIISIDFSIFDISTTSINDMNSLFSGFTSLQTINFGNLNFSTVIDMSGMSNDWKYLKSISLSNFILLIFYL